MGIAYQRCGTCNSTWYFRRSFCPRCGAGAPANVEAKGEGTIEAVTTVTRAPSPEWKAYAPYTMVLVAMPEGFRMMAHAEPGVAIGDKVTAEFVAFGERSIPKFKKT
ncbi:hypothetical protein GJW-30_1_03908 [Variibacter gotjawalensis]|uniref:ChsH2 C-terminal OB-fold domain-containing protein n=1 Tax=Variibacter gotjawalensis TaxID=1333996 RepID=A0A0S3PZJ6_9BRAD|nr:OB-fold domain-containing protein [Variibacter gotjawalensis]NIK47189.1 putative OB-fold protein [Variibacter gotjawalensis]RZS49089.1 hypothetical protein EV661_1514 [Variibacter gotjawalensis]BAT61351.1 hypothetical protein GJW-30_1_03908 [Variibacter gotjawalensis]